MNKWYNSKTGWLSFFYNSFRKIRPLVAYHSGSQAGNQLDKYRDINEQSSDEDLRILYGVLFKAWDEAPDEPWIHNMTGWTELCDLCSEGHILWEDRELEPVGKDTSTRGAGGCSA